MKEGPSPRLLIVTFVALMLLFALTAGLSWVPMGPFNIVVALLIGLAKMLLIILIFMEVRFSKQIIWVAAGLGFFWLGIMFTLSLNDYVFRGFFHVAGH